MPRKYTKINQYEKEILQWKSEGITNREIARRLGMEYSQVIIGYHGIMNDQRKLKAGIVSAEKKAGHAKTLSERYCSRTDIYHPATENGE